VSREWYDVGRFLGPSISSFYERFPVSHIGELWAAAGIDSVQMRRMSLGGGVVTWGMKRNGA
jgi:hypothetical protein